MTEKRFILKEYVTDHYGILDNGEEIAYADHRSAFTICDLLNELAEDNEQLKKEAKHQQGQKQRLMNYLQQYLPVEEIREIANDDKYLSGEELEKELEE